MRKKQKQNRQHTDGPSDHSRAPSSDFYAGAPAERPLTTDRPEKDPLNSRRTLRHQKASGRNREKGDPRERAALFSVLKAAIVLVFLFLLFFMLMKGIKLYEESIYLSNQPVPELSPVLTEVTPVDDFDISAQQDKESFSDRIAIWNETERLERSVADLLLRNNVDKAIERCQQVLRLDPFHIGALEQLGELYLQQERFLEAINTYIRLLAVDPSRPEYQFALLKSLAAKGDAEATITVANWYQDRNIYDEDVQRYLANAYFMQERYAEAASAYERVLKDTPRDVEVLDKQVLSYMRLEQYEKALTALEKLVSIEFRDPVFYRRLAICYAQLGRGEETVQVMGKSAHLFGADTVAMWIQDPLMDPVRMQRSFKTFADTVVTAEYRQYLEEMAMATEGHPQETVGPRLGRPEEGEVDTKLLNPLDRPESEQ